MDVLCAIQGRRSIRQYSTQAIEDTKLSKVLEAARLSPSAGNRQSWKFIIVRDSETRAKLAKAAGEQLFVGKAPIIIIACGTDPESIMTCGQYRHTVDLSIATAYMILEAYEQGLGTCWLGKFDEKKVREILGIPEGVKVVAMTPIGYPADNPATTSRKKLDEIVCYERYE